QAAMPWSPSLPGERGGCHRFSGDLGLHVERPPAPQEAIIEVPGPRIVAPFGRVSQHRVDVPEITQRRSRARSLHGGDQVGPLLVRCEELNLEPGIVKVTGQILDRWTLVSGRV